MNTKSTQHNSARTLIFTAKDIKKFADFLFEFLDIPPIEIDLLTKEQMHDVPGSTPNTEACLSTLYNGDEVVQQRICVRRRRKYAVMDLATLAHEIRHFWQYCMDETFYFSGYSEEMSETEYNRHPSEIDANAFAMLAIEYTIGIKGTRNYRNDPVTQQLYDQRFKELKAEYC